MFLHASRWDRWGPLGPLLQAWLELSKVGPFWWGWGQDSRHAWGEFVLSSLSLVFGLIVYA